MKNALTYWQRYDKVYKNLSFTKLYMKILGFAKKLGEPLTKKGKRGRNFKAKPHEYASYMVFEIVTHNSPFRDMELGSELYIGKHIDHSTFGKIFQKIHYMYLINLLELVEKFLKSRLGTGSYLVADSTGMHSKIYYEDMHKGKIIKRKRRFKTHVLIESYPDKSATCIRTGIGSTLHTSDAEGARQMIKRCSSYPNTFLADRGYDFEKVYQECKQNDIKTNIKLKEYRNKKSKCRNKAIRLYDPDLYKARRGVVETVFGGLRNKGLLRTRFRKEDNIHKLSIICLIRHNLFTLLRFTVGPKSYLMFI